MKMKQGTGTSEDEHLIKKGTERRLQDGKDPS